MAESKYLSVQEAATELRMSVENLRRYIRRGEFPVVAKVGRQYLIRPEAVQEFIERAAVKPATAKGE
jgi:excisionase family DNA binding protein